MYGTDDWLTTLPVMSFCLSVHAQRCYCSDTIGEEGQSSSIDSGILQQKVC